MRVALVLATALVLAGCSGSPEGPAPSSAGTTTTAASTAPSPTTTSAAPSRALTASDLTDVIAAAPPVGGKGGVPGTEAAAEQVRRGHARLSAAAQAATITPSACAAPLRAALDEDADAQALGVGSYGGLPVELRSFRDAEGPKAALSAIARASGACRSFTGSVLGRKVTGSFDGSPIEGSGADSAYGAIVALDTGSGTEEEARVLAAVGPVLVLFHAPQGTRPDDVSERLRGIVATTRAALQQG